KYMEYINVESAEDTTYAWEINWGTGYATETITINVVDVAGLDGRPITNVSNLTELTIALGNAEKTTINITADIETGEKILVNRAVTINGGNHRITFTGDAVNWQGNYVLHVYNTTGVTISNLKLNGGDAGLLVNGSTVTVANIKTEGNEFGGVEVSKGAATGLNDPKLTVSGTNEHISPEAAVTPAIWIDGKTINDGWVEGDLSSYVVGPYTEGGKTQYFFVNKTVNISTVNELLKAVKYQLDGQEWVIQSGTYDVPRDMVTLRDYHADGQIVASVGQAGWYLPITADNLTVTGVGNPVITSSVTVDNGALASQNLITVWGDNVTFRGLTITPKVEVNKSVEVVGDKKFTIEECTFTPNTIVPGAPANKGGSLYFNGAGTKGTKPILVRNNTFNYATVAFDGVEGSDITVTGNTFENVERYAVGNTYWGSAARMTVQYADVKVNGNNFNNVTDSTKIIAARLNQTFILNAENKINGSPIDKDGFAGYINFNNLAYWPACKDNKAVVDGVEYESPYKEAGEVVSNETELSAALADAYIEKIYFSEDIELDGTLVIKRAITIDGAGYSVNKAINIATSNVTLKNLKGAVVDKASHNLTGIGGGNAFYVNGKNILLENISADGDDVTDPTCRAVIGHTGSKFTVRNSSFINVTTGIFAHSGNTEPTARQVSLTATDNTFENVLAGIGGTEKTDLIATGNTFVSIQAGGEGIGLGKGSVVLGDYTGDDEDYLQNNNTFNYTEGNKVKDYRAVINVAAGADLKLIIEGAADNALVYLAAGNYTLNTSIVPNKNITVIGAGKNSTVVKTSFKGSYGSFQATNNHRLVLKNLTFETIEPTSATARNGHYVVATSPHTGNTDILVDNCIINGYYTAVYLNNVNTNNNRLTITNNIIDNCDWAYSIDNITPGAQDIKSENLLFSGNTGNSVNKGREVFASAKVLLVGSDGGSKGVYGTIQAAIGTAVNGDTIMINGIFGDPGTNTNYDVTKSVNIIGYKGNKVYGSFIVTADNVTLEGLNIEVSAGSAIIALSSANISILNNTLKGIGSEGKGINQRAQKSPGNVTISGNTISDFDIGISIDQSKIASGAINNNITGNTVSNTRKGIIVGSESKATVTANTVQNASAVGIEISSEFEGNLIENNIFHGNTKDMDLAGD
ncbi:MAG TPA: right-handed parallel beta-helix repeat-containing protein, partial [Clostridia bacterium]|nr:right-handed parallel beta-helix repeat-containing protein [Clostridia bacterium]